MESPEKYESPAFDMEERLLDFAARVIRVTQVMDESRAANHIAAQMLRSGTSPVANHAEAQAAESRRDFIHKMSICLKELRETSRWLRLIARASLVKRTDHLLPLIDEADQLVRIFKSSVRTAKSNTPSAVGEDPPPYTV